MKAINKKSGSVNLVREIIGDYVKLENLSTHNIRGISYEQFKTQYRLVNDNEVGEIPRLNMADEIMEEVNGKNPTRRTRSKEKAKPAKKEPEVSSTKRAQKAGGTKKLGDLSSNPTKARRLLRKAGVDKPYEWSDPQEIQKILHIIGEA